MSLSLKIKHWLLAEFHNVKGQFFKHMVLKKMLHTLELVGSPASYMCDLIIVHLEIADLVGVY